MSLSRHLRFDGRVAVVTGAGGGLGKVYALLLAERGASVVVNDLGGNVSGDGHSSAAADAVVDQIIKQGGQAVPNYESVSNGEKIISTAIQQFGRIDILVNSHGILRDRSFWKMNYTDWQKVVEVHLDGTFHVTRAAWDHFRNNKYGRIVMTSSASGLLGNFGQANYAAAKAGVVGFAQTLAAEGEKFNIHTNTIVPVAISRMTETLLSNDLHNVLKPELVAPVVSWLCHEDCQDNGSIIETCGGVATKYQWLRGRGALLRSSLEENVTLESVRNKWPEITNMDKGDMPKSIPEMTAYYFQAFDKFRNSEDQLTKFNLTDYKFPESEVTYTQKDAVIYALGVGMSITDADGIKYLYEDSEDFRVLPTFPVILGLKSNLDLIAINELNIDQTKILHGEQYLELYRPLDSWATIKIKSEVVDVLDKITGTLFVFRVVGETEDGPVFMSESAIFEVGSGKFGGNRISQKVVSKPVSPPKRKPDEIFEFTTTVNQAALYRLSGDLNPLHIDPEFSAKGGFPKPILHGLCSMGIAARIILQNYAQGNPKYFKAIKARFSKPVLPGDVLEIQTWAEGTRIHFEVEVKGKNDKVISGGYVELDEEPVIQRQKTHA